MAPKKSKKTSSRTRKTDVKVKRESQVVVETPTVVPTQRTISLPALKVSPKVLATAAVLLGVGVLTYKVAPWLVPAIVDNTPVTRWQVYSRMDKVYGAQVLDDLVNETILDKTIARSNVKVDKVEVDAQLAKLEEQFKTMGGLDEALKSRGMTREDLTKQITTQLAVEAILADKINPTDEEVQKYFDENSKTLYKDKKLDEVKAEIVNTLKQTKLQEEFMTWFAEAKKSVTVRNYTVPTPAPTQQ